SREGVQRDLLPIVEGSTVQTRYGYVRTDHVLFIAAGAFHVSKPSDLIPELQGRFPIRVELQPLTEEDFVRIMTEPENALTKQYAALCAAEGATLEFTADGIKEIARIAAKANERMENIGARRLHTVMTNLLEDVLFDLPDVQEKRIKFDAARVRERLAITDLTRDEILRLFDLARRMKAGAYRETPLAGKTLAMIFAKSSTRTRVSFEVGTYQLGGQALFLSSRDIQIGRGEPIPDTARVLSRYVDGIMIRTFDHGEVEQLALHATVPVINGLTDLSHPCQVLADLFTVREALGGWEGK